MRRSVRGVTLVEVMISLGIVLVGLVALFRILGSSIAGSATASRLSQAQARATVILENVRNAPASTLGCLTAQLPANWGTCETDCRNAQTMAGAPLDKCVFQPASMSTIPGPAMQTMASGFDTGGQASDRAQQQYSLVYAGTFVERDTFARRSGTNSRIVEVQVAIGWNDNNTVGAIATTTTYDHVVSFRTGVFQ